MLIGGLELKNRLCLAPLAGVTSLPVREFFTELGVALTHTEMISCAGLIRDNAKTFDMLETSEHEGPLIIQLFASDSNTLISGAERAITICKKFSGLGINMACPMPKITKNGSGSALLRKPEIAREMVKGLKALGYPVWVKIRRLEKDSDTLNFIEGLANSGADNICLHGRTASQRYEGLADRNITRLACEKFPGLISASGDVRTMNDIDDYLALGCVAVMLARGIIADPFLFSGNKFDSHTQLEILINFAKRAEYLSGEHKALVLMKRFAGSVLRFSEGSAEKRKRACMSTRLNEIIEILQK